MTGQIFASVANHPAVEQVVIQPEGSRLALNQSVSGDLNTTASTLVVTTRNFRRLSSP